MKLLFDENLSAPLIALWEQTIPQLAPIDGVGLETPAHPPWRPNETERNRAPARQGAALAG